MRRPCRILPVAALVAVLIGACATTPVADPGGDPAASTPAEGSADPTHERHAEGITVRIDGGTSLELILRQDEIVHRWSLEHGETFHSLLVHPDASTDTVDVVVLVLDGERPLLRHVSARPGGASAIAQFPDHLQPSHEVDTGPPALAWTPDGRSLVWTEPSGDSMILRVVGWENGPAVDHPADDHLVLAPDVPGGAQVDGFEVTSESSWRLILRGGGSNEPITVPAERQPDGALALPPT